MTTKYVSSLVVTAAGIGSISSALATDNVGLGLLLAGSSFPLAVLLAVRARLSGRFPVPALFGGAIVGIIVAVVSYGLVFAFAYAFLLGFATEGTELLDALRVDSRLTTVLASPWILVLVAEVVIVAPITEEFGKALGARWSKPASSQEALLTGVAAGAGFAVVENVLYALGGAWAGGPWTEILLARLPGAAVHPLATGLVVLGWWEWRNRSERSRSIRLIFGGVGVHALWNGSLVALTIAEIAFEVGSSLEAYAAVSLAYVAAMGAVAAAALWWLSSSVSGPSERDRTLSGFADGRSLGAWAVLSASLLIPLVMLLLAFPDFYLG
jgi:RsiW-degrading membrane proteinase PrsW (M82 family)